MARRYGELYLVHCFLIWTIWMMIGTITCQADISAATNEVDETTVSAVLARTRGMRLPNSTFPLEYHVHIITNIHLGDLQFKGNVTIDIDIRESTDEIILHSANLKNFIITITELSSDNILRDITYTYDGRRHFLIIHAVEYYQVFEVGHKYRIEILYDGVMNEMTTGLYWLAYRDTSNQISYQAATQFEPTHAREVLPCYDEPSFKANFTIRITHGRIYNAISNMEASEVIEHGETDLSTTIFHKTPPMSTYLVAFVISNFVNISETYQGVTHRLFAPKTAKNKGAYQLHLAGRTTAAFESYLGVKYPLNKMDHVALSKNYGAAMENWGLITYKEDCLLYSPDDELLGVKAPLTIVHEIAHQWFGNLVSPEWWSYIWLNEGFATYFSYIIVDLLLPKLKAMDHFLIESDKAYDYNKFATNRHPITVYVEEDRNIANMFDTITYTKAACVIRMFHHAFNRESFMRGLRLFLTKYQYTVANEMDLFQCMQQALQEDNDIKLHQWLDLVPSMMLSWTQSKLSPIIKIVRNYENNTITVQQLSRSPSLAEHLWIPLNFATGSNHNFSHTAADYFMPPRQEITLQPEDLGITITADDWLIVNKQQTGFYHVLYDDENLKRIALALRNNHNVIHQYNRADIFRNIRPLIEHNQIESAEVIFELLKYLHSEDNWLVWYSVQPTLRLLEQYLYETESHEAYKGFVRDLIGPIYHKYFSASQESGRTTTGMPGSENLLHRSLLITACAVELPECLDYARRLAFAYIYQHIHIGYTKRDSYIMTDAILCSALRYLSNEEFNNIVEVLSSSNHTTEHYDDVLISLHCNENPEGIQRYLNMVLGSNSTEYIMNEVDAVMIIKRLCRSNIKARSLLMEFIGNNYKTLVGLSYYAEIFNTVAEFVPSRKREEFQLLHQKVLDEMILQDVDNRNLLYPINSDHIGANLKVTESFVGKFGQDIQKWLIRNQQPVVHAASFGITNAGPHRFGRVLRIAGNLYKKVLDHISKSGI